MHDGDIRVSTESYFEAVGLKNSDTGAFVYP